MLKEGSDAPVNWHHLLSECVKVYFSDLFLQILDEIEEQGIKTYELPDCESDEDEDYVEQTKQLKVFKYFTLYSFSFRPSVTILLLNIL